MTLPAPWIIVITNMPAKSEAAPKRLISRFVQDYLLFEDMFMKKHSHITFSLTREVKLTSILLNVLLLCRILFQDSEFFNHELHGFSRYNFLFHISIPAFVIFYIGAMLICARHATSFGLSPAGLTVSLWGIAIRRIPWSRVTGVQMLTFPPEGKKMGAVSGRVYDAAFLVTLDRCPLLECYGETCEEKALRHHIHCYPFRSVCYLIPKGKEADYKALLCYYRNRGMDTSIPKYM